MGIDLDALVQLKVERDEAERQDPLIYSKTKIYQKSDGKNLIRIKGTPNLSNVRTILMGIRNPGDSEQTEFNDGMPKSAEIWFNELRLTDFNNQGGWAANARGQVRLADLGMISVAGSTSSPGFGSLEQKVDQRSKEEINQIDVSTNLELGKLLPEKAQVSVPLYVAVSKTVINPEYSPSEPDRLLKDAIKEAPDDELKDEIKELSQDIVKRTSVNLTNVRVNQEFERLRLLSPSNFSLTLGYSETEAHSYSVERNNTIRYGLAFNYVYNVRPKNIAPFAQSQGFRSPYLRFIRDFNFTPLPARIAYRSSFDRYYNEVKLRNVYQDREIRIDSTVSKDFVWNKGFDLNWDITRALKFDFSLTNLSRVEEDQGAYDWFRNGNNSEWAKSVWGSIMEGGRTVNYNHNFNVTYSLPLNKFPIFNWTSVSLRYNSSYQWMEGPVFQGSRSLGNSISNSNTMQANANLNLSTLYNKLDLLRRIDAKYSGTGQSQVPTRLKTVSFVRENVALRQNTTRNFTHRLNTLDVDISITDRNGQAIDAMIDVLDENRISITADTTFLGVTLVVSGEVPAGENPFVFIGENIIRLATGLKNLSISYSGTNSTVLQGFLPRPRHAGISNETEFSGAPGLPFILGYQDSEFVKNAASRGWLTDNAALTSPYMMNQTENLNIRGTYEPFRGFRVELTSIRSYTRSASEYFYHSDTVFANNGFYFDNRLKNGSFSMSIISIGTAFEKISSDDGYRSENFEKFKEYRQIISQRLHTERVENSGIGYQGSIQQPIDQGYTDGYGATSSEVIIPAFIAAYTGKDPDKVSLDPFPGYTSMMPNWRLTFDGLSRIGFLTDYIRSSSITHSYSSTYNVNSYITNFGFIADESDGLSYIRDIQNNFIPELQINTVSIRENMSPLLGIDIGWQNSLTTRMEFRKSRLLALSLSNNQLTESLNNELIIGAGYRFNAVPLRFGEQSFESDLNLRFDLSIRDNKTIIRYLALTNTFEVDQITSGDRLFKIMITADYLLSSRFNLQLFFDRTMNKPHTSRSFLRVDTNAGFSLRFTLTE